MNRLRKSILILCAGLLLGGVAVYAALGRHAQRGAISRSAAGAPPEVASAFAVLRGPGRPAPARVRRVAREVPGPVPLNVEYIYGASTPVGRIWVAYASGNLCVFAGSPLAISCSPIGRAEKAGVMLGLIKHPKSGGGPHSDRRFIVYGVMPNSKSNLTLEVGRGHTRLHLGPSGLFGLQSRWPIAEPRR